MSNRVYISHTKWQHSALITRLERKKPLKVMIWPWVAYFWNTSC